MQRTGVYLKNYWRRYAAVDILVGLLLMVVTVVSTGIFTQLRHNAFYKYLLSEPYRDMGVFLKVEKGEYPSCNDFGTIQYGPEAAPVVELLSQKTKCGSYTTGSFYTDLFDSRLSFIIGDSDFNKIFPRKIRAGKGFSYSKPEVIISYSKRQYYRVGETYTFDITLSETEGFRVDACVVGYLDGLNDPSLSVFNFYSILNLPALPDCNEQYEIYPVTQEELDAIPTRPVWYENRLYTIGNTYARIPKSSDDLNLIAYGAFILFMLIVFIIMTGAYVNGRNQRKLQGTALLVGISKRDLFVANLLRAAAIFVFSLVVSAVAIAWAGQTFYQLTFGGLPVGALVPLALCGLLALIDYLQLRKLEIHAVLKAET